MSKGAKVRIGTRGSKLALWQSNHVADILSDELDREIELEIIKTTGDKITDVPLAKVGDKGLFVKEIETALLDGSVDIAVHSMKDMPTALPDGLTIGAAMVRENPRDVLICSDSTGFSGGRGEKIIEMLDPGSKIGTSSLRRRAQLMYLRSDLEIVDIRGNLDTRLQKLDSDDYDAIVLAGAGVRRLGLGNRITAEIAADAMLPAVGQGAICIEVRVGDENAGELCAVLNDTPTHLAIRAERALMRSLEGGCQVPIGALAHLTESGIEMRALVASLDGERVLRAEGVGSPREPEELGERLAAELRELGADDILESIRSATP